MNIVKLQMGKNETAYEAASKVILSKYEKTGESIVVTLRQKYEDWQPWENLTVLFINEPIDAIHSKYIWETDWWEGQKFVELLAAAPITRINLDDYAEFWLWPSSKENSDE